MPLQPNDRVRVLTAGGGGHGEPSARLREQVVEDV